MGILLKPWRTDRNSAKQRKYVTTFEFLPRQADNKHRFESPDITRLARLLFRKWLVAYRTIVADNGYTIYCRPVPTIKRVRPMDASNHPSVLRQYILLIVVSSLKFRMMAVASFATAMSSAESCKNHAFSQSSVAWYVVLLKLLSVRSTSVSGTSGYTYAHIGGCYSRPIPEILLSEQNIAEN